MTLFSKTLYGVDGGGEEEKVKFGGSFISERTASGWKIGSTHMDSEK